MGKSNESLLANEDQVIQLIPEEQSKPHTKGTREYRFITYQQAVENASDPNMKNKYKWRFLDKNDEAVKKIINSFTKEVANYLHPNTIENIELRVKKGGSLAAWISPKDNKGELKIDGSLKVTFLVLISISRRNKRVAYLAR